MLPDTAIRAGAPAPYDAIIIGGSFAGLSAATYIARARRSVCIVDAGAPRNRFAAHSHGFLAQDGSDPAAILATARAQVSAYPTVRFISARATDARIEEDRFRIDLDDCTTLHGRKLVLAYGLSDDLPAIPGLAERWGASVIHCPYCHGYEFSGQRLGVLASTPMSAHQAMLVAEWGPVTFYLNGQPAPDPQELAELEQRGVAIEPAAVTALHGDLPHLSGIELANGRIDPLDALYVGPRTRFNSDIAQKLGCAVDEHAAGAFIRTDSLKETTVPGVYAAGDIARGAHSVAWACGDGVMAGVATHRSLVFG